LLQERKIAEKLCFEVPPGIDPFDASSYSAPFGDGLTQFLRSIVAEDMLQFVSAHIHYTERTIRGQRATSWIELFVVDHQFAILNREREYHTEKRLQIPPLIQTCLMQDTAAGIVKKNTRVVVNSSSYRAAGRKVSVLHDLRVKPTGWILLLSGNHLRPDDICFGQDDVVFDHVDPYASLTAVRIAGADVTSFSKTSSENVFVNPEVP
jgi:hypothetical protein